MKASSVTMSTSPHVLADDPFMTRREAADYLRLGYSTLAKLALTGGGPPMVKMGASVRYRRSSLDSWAAARVRVSTSAATMAAEAGERA